MSTLGRLFLSLIKGLRNGWSHLNSWAEEHYYLIEIDAVALNGPPDGWTYPTTGVLADEPPFQMLIEKIADAQPSWKKLLIDAGLDKVLDQFD